MSKGPGYFKMNNLILVDEIQLRNAIEEVIEINNVCNPNTLWELIKGTVHNETIKYTTQKRNDLYQINKLEEKPNYSRRL